MSTGKQLTALLLLTTALTIPGAAFAQDTGVGTGAEGVPAEEDPATDAAAAQEVEGIDDTPQEEEFEEPEVSVPGGSIVVTGRRRQDVTRASSQVVSVLDSASIARTGEGDIAGALTSEALDRLAQFVLFRFEFADRLLGEPAQWHIVDGSGLHL